MIGKAIHGRLGAVAGVTALVGTRIYPSRLPQGPTYPAIRYQVIDAPRTHLMTRDPGEVHARVQVDSYSKTYAQAQAVAAQVRLALSRWEGTAGGVTVEHVFLDDERDLDEPQPLHDGETGIYRVMQDYIAHYFEEET